MSAGSIYKKLRGLNIKSRAWIEILLHYVGVLVYFSKTQGLSAKTEGPNVNKLKLWGLTRKKARAGWQV